MAKKKVPKLITTSATLHFKWEIKRNRPRLVSVELQPNVIDTIVEMMPIVTVAAMFGAIAGMFGSKKRRRK